MPTKDTDNEQWEDLNDTIGDGFCLQDSETVRFDDINNISVSFDLEYNDDSSFIKLKDKEYEFSFEITLSKDYTLCFHCGEVTVIPNTEFLFTVGVDPNCLNCGFPLKVVR